jgi:hypothetical protein
MITQEQFLSLSSDTITKKEYDALIEKITLRCDYIVRKCLQKEIEAGSEGNFWWDFDNRAWDLDGNFIQDGYFDEKEYQNTVSFYFETYRLSVALFPTEWIWTENFEDELKADKLKIKIYEQI